MLVLQRLPFRRAHILPKTELPELSGLSGFHLFSLGHWQKIFSKGATPPTPVQT
jgi:hypothetical protein